LGIYPVNDLSLLTLAVAACQETVAQQLVASGASANGSGAPLVTAAAKGEVSLAQFLLQAGAKIDQIDEDGHTALETAVRQHELGTVTLLLEKGADPNRVIGGNATVLDIAKSSSDPTDQAIAKALREFGASDLHHSD
jgi:ankyrin repeat protein